VHLDRLAEAYVWAGRYDEARAAYNRALAIEPDARASIAFSAIPFLYARQLLYAYILATRRFANPWTPRVSERA